MQSLRLEIRELKQLIEYKAFSNTEFKEEAATINAGG